MADETRDDLGESSVSDEPSTVDSPPSHASVQPGSDDSFLPSVAPEDLSADATLRGCDEIDFLGESRRVLGGITLLAHLGRGGMGVVYLGFHQLLRVEVAVKVLPLAVMEHRGFSAERFLREARYAARLQSEHLVAVRDVGQDAASGCYFIVMEYVHGLTGTAWRKRSKRGATDEAEALEICIAATKGLVAAHLEGIVHRDIKPENILIPRSGGVLQHTCAKLADLGLARADAGEGSLTQTDVAMGTPGYMAPEQVLDARSARKPADVFGMGATLYSLLTGRAPFAGKSPSDALIKTTRGQYTPLDERRANVSPGTAALVHACLQHEPTERFPDGPALLAALESCRARIEGGGGNDEVTVEIAGFLDRAEEGREVLETPPDSPPPMPTPSPLHDVSFEPVETTVQPRRAAVTRAARSVLLAIECLQTPLPDGPAPDVARVHGTLAQLLDGFARETAAAGADAVEAQHALARLAEVVPAQAPGIDAATWHRSLDAHPLPGFDPAGPDFLTRVETLLERIEAEQEPAQRETLLGVLEVAYACLRLGLRNHGPPKRAAEVERRTYELLTHGQPPLGHSKLCADSYGPPAGDPVPTLAPRRTWWWPTAVAFALPIVLWFGFNFVQKATVNELVDSIASSESR